MYKPSHERIFYEGLLFPEGPSFDVEGNLYVAEIARSCITVIDPSGRGRVFAALGGGPNGSAFGPDGALYVMNNGGLAFANKRPAGKAPDNTGGRVERVWPDGRFETLFTHCDGVPLEAPNDIAFDAFGGFYFTDSHHGTRQQRPIGQIYYCNVETQTIRRVADGLQLPNGIAVAHDGRSLVAVETIPRLVVRFDIRETGELGPKRILAELPEGCLPDGIAIDFQGQIVCGGLGLGIVIAVDPLGGPGPAIQMDCSDPTNLAFGRDGRTLFVTEGVLGRVVEVDWPEGGPLLTGQPRAPRPNGDP